MRREGKEKTVLILTTKCQRNFPFENKTKEKGQLLYRK